jgi:hypothetical protein
MNALQRSLNLIARTSVNSLSAIASRQSKDSTLGSSTPVAKQDLAGAIERYRSIGLWKTDLRVAPGAITDIQRLIIDGGGTKTKRHRCYRDVVDMRFAQAALSTYPSGVPGERIGRFETEAGCG